MKTAVSIPDTIFKAADSLARRMGWSRSQLYTKAISEYLSDRDEEEITRALNHIYNAEPSSLDDSLKQLQFASLNKEEW